jgi:plasmid stabilization system protein ParE
MKFCTGSHRRPVALGYAAKFRLVFGHLTTFPKTGARRPKLWREMRIWPVTLYVIFYRFVAEDATVRVVRLLDGRRDVAERLFGPRNVKRMLSFHGAALQRSRSAEFQRNALVQE